jgi:YD repeat-containing protein
MKNILLFLIAFFVACTSAFCQVSGPNGYLPNYDPPSPEASAFGKYVDHPVGYFTGTPKIDIPLFQIKTGRITVPISLSYHASGVKVDEVASRVGIGWVLNAGGVITRTAKGFADDVSGAGFGVNTGTDISFSSEVGYFDNTGAGASVNSTSIIPGHNFAIQYDLEPDPYFYNFGDKSGKLYFLDRTTPYVINKDPLVITGPYSGTNQFTVTTEDGLVYTFAAAEGTNNVTFSGITYSYTSAWYLTQISDPVTGKNVTFTYRTDMPSVLSYSYKKSISMLPFCAPDGGGGGSNVNQNSQQILNTKVLDRITYDEGYIEFKADYSRQDLTGDKAYTQVNKYVYIANTPVLVKGYNLGYTTTSNGTPQENHRLYLDTLKEKGADGSFHPPYLFYYKNRTAVPERDSPQQDIWGYYNANGAATTDPPQYPKVYVHSNGTQTDYLPFDNPASPAPTVIAGVETSSNPATIDDGTLNQITYPTQGYTTYIYEINQFNGSYTGGGIRIKEIDDYTAPLQKVLSKTYQYNSGLLGGPFPQIAYPTADQGLIRFSLNRSVLGSSDGSYVGYGVVTETQVSSTGSNNGMTVYSYTTDTDVPGSFVANNNNCTYLSNLTSLRASTYFPFFEMESREQRRGLLTEQDYYDGSSFLRKQIDYAYSLSSRPITSIHSSLMQFGQNNAVEENLHETRNLNAEKMLLVSKTENDFYGTSPTHVPSVSDITNYTYCGGADNDQFTRSETHFGSGSEPTTGGGFVADNFTQTTYKYPFDYAATASGGIMGSMVAMNYINPVINQVNTMSAPINGTPVTYYTDAKINDYMHNPYYASGTLPNAIVPKQVFAINLTAPVQQQPGVNNPANYPAEPVDPSNPGSLYEKRLQYLSYDAFSNPTVIQHDNLYEGLSWSIFGQLLSKTATPNPLASTFSAPPQSWTEAIDPNAKIGGTDFTWNGSKTAFPFSIDGTQPTIVSFWAKGGTFSIEADGNPSVGNIIINQTAPATWQYYSFSLATTGQGWQGAPVYLTGSATLDGVSISTDNGQRTTYYYDALKQLQLTIDPTNKIRSFEYDAFQRLINIRDENGNIIKSFCYNYAGGPVGCAVVSPVSKVNFTLTNTTGVSGFVANFTSEGNSYPFNFPSSGSTVVQLPVGTYTLTINPVDAPTNRKFLLGSRAPVTAPGTSFTNVIVSTINSESPIIIQQP